MRRGTVLLTALVAAACAPQNGEANATPSARQPEVDTVQVRGTVAVVGAAPVDVAVIVRDADGESSRIDGPLTDEIGRLAGAEVEVTGARHHDPRYGQAVRADRYVIRAVDGRPVITGVVERAADGGLQLRTEAGEVVRLVIGGDRIRPGQKIWIQGSASVQVQSFGVIRP
jgi:hypothetical protein